MCRGWGVTGLSRATQRHTGHWHPSVSWQNGTSLSQFPWILYIHWKLWVTELVYLNFGAPSTHCPGRVLTRGLQTGFSPPTKLILGPTKQTQIKSVGLVQFTSSILSLPRCYKLIHVLVRDSKLSEHIWKSTFSDNWDSYNIHHCGWEAHQIYTASADSWSQYARALSRPARRSPVIHRWYVDCTVQAASLTLWTCLNLKTGVLCTSYKTKLLWLMNQSLLSTSEKASCQKIYICI